MVAASSGRVWAFARYALSPSTRFWAMPGAAMSSASVNAPRIAKVLTSVLDATSPRSIA